MQTHTRSAFSSLPVGVNRSLIPRISPILKINFSKVKDIYFDGAGEISGKVSEQALPSDIPVIRKVALYLKETGALIRQQWSNAAGEYSFTNIDERFTYYVVAFDHTGTYNAVIRDNIVPVVP